jgi:GNAT superfamily N-acetyltransferase
MGFSYRIETGASFNNCTFNFYLDKIHIGKIIFHISYTEIIIAWLTIFSTDSHRKGYGTKMLQYFEKYAVKTNPSVKSLVLVPKDFDGKNKNYLCTFYEKSGFVQEVKGHPSYIKKLASI